MPVKVYNRATQQTVEVDPSEAQRGVQQGEYDLVDKTVKVRQGNRTGTVNAADLLTALGQGAELTDHAGAAETQMRREEESLAGQIQGGAEATLAGATLGLSSAALEALGADSERMRLRRDVLGKGGTALELLGAAVPAFMSGGASLGASGGRGLASTVLRSTPAGLVSRGAARAEGALARSLGTTPAARILPSGARNFIEGAAQGTGAQLDENVLGDRELNADLLNSATMGGLFGAGAGYAIPGLAKIGAGAVMAPVRGMQGVLGRMNAASGGMASREVAEMLARKVDDLPNTIARFADERLPQMWKDNAIRQGIDPDVAERLSMMARTPEGVADIVRLERDAAKIDGDAAMLLTEKLPSVHAQMDEARRLSGGASKAEYWKRLGPKTPEAQRAAAGETDKLFASSRAKVQELAGKNRSANAEYGGGATYSASMLSQVNDAIAALERKIDDAGRGLDEATGAKRLSYDELMQRAGSPKTAVDMSELATRKAMAADAFKRRLGEIIDENGGWGKMRQASPEVRATNIELRRMYGAAKEHLERTDLWGEAAGTQAKLNAMYRNAAEADDLFKEATAGTGLSTIVNPDGTFNATKALKLVRAHGRVGGDVAVQRLTDALDARLQYFDEVAKHVEMDDAGRAALSKLGDDVKAIKAEFRRQAVDAGKLDDLRTARVVEGNGSPSLLTTGTSLAGIMGFGIGGAPGALLGAALVAARQPATTLKRYAALRHALDKQDIQLSKAIKGMFDKAKPAVDLVRGVAKSAASAAKTGAEAVGRAAVATGKGIERGGVIAAGHSGPEARTKRRETALDNAIRYVSSPNAIEQALAVPHYDLHDAAPGLAGVMQQRVQKAAAFLQSKAPKVYSRPNSKTKLVDPVSAASFERYLEAVVDPIGALARFQSGRITAETAEAIRICYPALYADVQRRIQDHLSSEAAEGREVPYETRVKLGLTFQTPTDPSLQAPVANEIQLAIGASYDEPTAQQAMGGMQQPSGHAGKFDNPGRTSRSLQTGSERAASWRTTA